LYKYGTSPSGKYYRRTFYQGSSLYTSAQQQINNWPQYTWDEWLYLLNPVTGLAWTQSDLDGVECGLGLYDSGIPSGAYADFLGLRLVYVNAAVSTQAATYIPGATTATLNGLVNEDEGETNCSVYFEYGPTTAYGSTTARQTKTKGQSFSASVTGIAGSYHYRAVIVTKLLRDYPVITPIDSETFYGADETIQTAALEIAFNQSIFTDPAAATWTDVTQEFMSAHTRRGRNHELAEVETGEAVFLLKNSSGNWWRPNTLGAYYPYVKPLTLIRFRKLWGGTIYPVFYGLIESITPAPFADGEAGMCPLATISCVDLFKSLARFKLSAANPSMTATASSGQKDVVVDTVANLVVGQSIKVYDTAASEVNYIDAIDATTLTVTMLNNLANSYTVGRSGRLKKFPSVLSGQRLRDCLLELGWPSAQTDIDDGIVYVIEHTPPTEGTQILQHMQSVVLAEDGNHFMAEDGKYTFQDANARTTAPLNVSAATFNDDDTDSKFVEPGMTDDDSYTYNEADIIGDGIGTQKVYDAAYQLEQGPRAITRNDSQIANGADAFAQAVVLVNRYKDSALRPSKHVVKPAASPSNLWPLVLGLGISRLITLNINRAPNLAGIANKYHIEEITHDWTQGDDDWVTQWQLWMANQYRVFMAGRQTSYFDKAQNSDANYATCRTAVAGNLVENGEGLVRVGQMLFGGLYYIARGLIGFTTTTLGAGVTVEAADLVVTAAASQIVDTSFQLQLCGAGSVNHPVELADYNTLYGQTASYGLSDAVISPWQPGLVVYVIHLNATGIAAINKTGITYFGLRSKNDVDGVAPTGNENLNLYGVPSPSINPPLLLVKLT
jgi:hypothetical protein